MKMTITRTSDMREFQSATLKEADQHFEKLAKAKYRMDLKKAQAEKKIAEITSKLLEDNKEDSEIYEKEAQWINSFVLTNKLSFIKPRMRKTEFGKYGVRGNPPKVQIVDPEAIIKSSDELGLQLYKTEKTVLLDAVREAISKGHPVKGAKVISGDTVGFSIDKHFLEEEVQQAS